jgi:hypothetical protein
MRTYTCTSFKQADHDRGGGGLSLQTLSSEERLRLAPFLTVLGERERERERERENKRERASERVIEREREREGEKEGEREREWAWYPRAGSVCSVVVAHRTISQVRPAHHVRARRIARTSSFSDLHAVPWHHRSPLFLNKPWEPVQRINLVYSWNSSPNCSWQIHHMCCDPLLVMVLNTT